MDISVNFKGGGSFIKLQPKFSSNAENVFASSHNSILEYNTKTGKVIHEYKGMKSNIVGFCCDVIDNFECIIACSENGQVIVWKILFKVKIFETVIPQCSINTFHLLSNKLENGLDVLTSYQAKNKVCFTLINLKMPKQQKKILKIEKEKYCIDVCRDQYFSVVQKNVVRFINLATFKISRYEMAKNNRSFTCVACHPNEEIVLTGDDTGRVLVWQNIFGKKSQAVFHWHTLPVKCVAFSSLGSYFYSGADECVLVKWQFDNPNQKQFWPRLPASISHITVSANNSFAAVATADNAIRIIDSRMNQISLIQHLVLGKQFESGIIYDPITRALVLNGNVGCVQFYSPDDLSLLYNIDIVNQNKITDERESKIENTEVRKVALSKSGKWLATVEERREENISKELRLKFWIFNSEKQMFELNTSIEYPHDSSVNSIMFQPLSKEENLKCVTIGNDKKFKIWQIIQTATVHRIGPVWKCLSIGFFRDLPCQSISFSLDGSLFATAFKTILTTWAPDICELKCSLVHPNVKETINFVQFGQGNQCHLVVTASKNKLCVWNLLTLSMIWMVNLTKVNLLVADVLSTYMIVICKNNQVFVFEPSSANIVYSSTDLLKKEDEIVAATFIPSKYSNDTRLKWYERSNLYFINSNSELHCISKSEEPYEYADNIEDLTEDASVFSKLKPLTKTSNVKHTTKFHLFEKDMGYTSYKEYLDAPIQTLPPIRLLAASLLKSLVQQKENVME